MTVVIATHKVSGYIAGTTTNGLLLLMITLLSTCNESASIIGRLFVEGLVAPWKTVVAGELKDVFMFR